MAVDGGAAADSVITSASIKSEFTEMTTGMTPSVKSGDDGGCPDRSLSATADADGGVNSRSVLHASATDSTITTVGPRRHYVISKDTTVQYRAQATGIHFIEVAIRKPVAGVRETHVVEFPCLSSHPNPPSTGATGVDISKNKKRPSVEILCAVVFRGQVLATGVCSPPVCGPCDLYMTES